MKRVKSKPTVTDLFSGAGLFSWAFAQLDFLVVAAVEQDRVAAATYSRNIGPHVCVEDIRRIVPRGKCDVLIAGPPCQGFSTLGKRKDDDPRNSLSLEVVRWARALEPRIVVIENVAAFLKAPVWQCVATRLRCMGYSISATIANATDFGVPQIRLRSFTFATRVGVPVLRPSTDIRARPTVRRAWAGLAKVPDGRNHHYAPTPSALALARMKIIPVGGDKRDVLRLAPHLAPPSWRHVAGEVTDVWGRLAWDAPSNTLRTALLNPSKGRYIHPDQNRVISLREAARLHSVPDEWSFVGAPTQIARQIGNSVPPLLGAAVAKAVLQAL